MMAAATTKALPTTISSSSSTPAAGSTNTHGYELDTFKPGFSGKLEEDPEAHLLRTLD